MLPSLRQRLIIGTAVLLGGAVWLSVDDLIRASDGGDGFTLVSARIGSGAAAVVVLIAGLPALALGIISSVSGSVLAGVFSVSAALTMLAWRGGSIEGYLWRFPPGGYAALIVEMMVWTVGLAMVIASIQLLRPTLRSRWPALVLGKPGDDDMQMKLPTTPAALSGLICALVGGLLAYFLLRTGDRGQVIVSLLLAFTVGGFAAQTILPQSNPVGVLLSPVLVALVAYGWVLYPGSGPDERLAFASQRLWGLALALPIHYASAAVAGCAMGVGWAGSLETPRGNRAT